ncbi:hypothetical protein AAMO2058_001159300 [Amorphochlora amoebiformis]
MEGGPIRLLILALALAPVDASAATPAPKATWACCRSCPHLHLPEVDDQFGVTSVPGDIDADTGKPVDADDKKEEDASPEPEPEPDCSRIDMRKLEGFGQGKCCKVCPISAVESFIEVHGVTQKHSSPLHYDVGNGTYKVHGYKYDVANGTHGTHGIRQLTASGNIQPPHFVAFLTIESNRRYHSGKQKKNSNPTMDNLRSPGDPTLVVEMPPCCPYCQAGFFDQNQYSDEVALPTKKAPEPAGKPINYYGPTLQVSTRNTGKEIIFTELTSTLNKSAYFFGYTSHRIVHGKHHKRHTIKTLRSEEVDPDPPKPARVLPVFESPDPPTSCCNQCPVAGDGRAVFRFPNIES